MRVRELRPEGVKNTGRRDLPVKTTRRYSRRARMVPGIASSPAAAARRHRLRYQLPHSAHRGVVCRYWAMLMFCAAKIWLSAVRTGGFLNMQQTASVQRQRNLRKFTADSVEPLSNTSLASHFQTNVSALPELNRRYAAPGSCHRIRMAES